MAISFVHLFGENKGRFDQFDSKRITIGRAPDNSLCFGDGERRVSSHHAEIVRRGDQYFLRDLGSTNGTLINGRRVMASELGHDDLIEFGAGGPLVRFQIQPAHAEEAPAGPAGFNGQPHAKDAGQQVGQNTMERMVDRAVKTKTNVRFISALVVALFIGGAAGILLYSGGNVTSVTGGSFSEVARRNSPAVVYIRTEFELVNTTGEVIAQETRSGSGFVVSPQGLIVTNRHLIQDWEYNTPPPGITGRTASIEVVFPGHTRAQARRATVYKLTPSPLLDVVILKIDPFEEMPVVKGVIDHPEQASQGEAVAVIGYPLGFDLFQRTQDARIEPSLSTGVVSRVSPDLVQLSLRAYQGNSGGPVLNLDGQVISILTANVTDAQDLSFSIPMWLVSNLLRSEAAAEAIRPGS